MNIDQAIYDTAILQGFTPISAKFIIAQARFESSYQGIDYNSPVFIKNNNISGMKFVNQPLATKGSKSPEGDYYAKYNTIQNAIDDKVNRLYNITRAGVSPQQLKDAKTPEEFADLLKRRGYYGNGKYGTPEGNNEQKNYANGLKAKLLKVNVLQFVNSVKKNNATLLVIGCILLVSSFYLYKKYKK